MSSLLNYVEIFETKKIGEEPCIGYPRNIANQSSSNCRKDCNIYKGRMVMD